MTPITPQQFEAILAKAQYDGRTHAIDMVVEVPAGVRCPTRRPPGRLEQPHGRVHPPGNYWRLAGGGRAGAREGQRNRPLRFRRRQPPGQPFRRPGNHGCRTAFAANTTSAAWMKSSPKMAGTGQRGGDRDASARQKGSSAPTCPASWAGRERIAGGAGRSSHPRRLARQHEERAGREG
ncbi:MAG: hypothetical protein IPJ94_09425 [Chloroflexi bacterium]|nr:hypothetical protein [Chloroflexota bacterium]